MNLRRLGLVFAICVGASQSVSVGQTSGDDSLVIGQWWTPGFSSRVDLARCGQELCGRIVWLWDPQSAKRGQIVLSGFVSDDGRIWRNGRAFNPADGNHYSATMSVLSNNRLKVSGCVLVFCREQIWLRVGSVEQTPIGARKSDSSAN